MKQIKHVGVFYSYFIYSSLMILPLFLLNIDIQGMSNGAYYGFLFGMDLIFVLILWFIYRKDLKKSFGDFKENWKKYIEIMIKAWGIGLLLMSLSNIAISYLLPVDTPENESLIKEIFDVVPIYILWSTAFYAPFVEEVVFRHSIRKVINTKWLYIFISGFVFGLTHVIYSAESLASLVFFIPYAFIGWAFAWIYIKTDNIWTTIIMHMFHNSILIGLLFIRTMVIG